MIEIVPPSRFKTNRIEVPGSKYIANRAVAIAALADGISTIHNLPDNEDINVALAGIALLGATVDKSGTTARISGTAGKIKACRIETQASGTFSRFVSALAAAGSEKVNIVGNEKMNTRPMGELFKALRALGVKVESTNDFLPAYITGPIRGGEVTLDGSVSSQYISALLIASPKAAGPVTLRLADEPVSKNYIDMTLDMLAKFGGLFERDGYRSFTMRPSTLIGVEITLEPDPVSATYFMAAAALLGEEILIPNFNKNTLQGEAAFPQLLERMGCTVTHTAAGLTMKGPSRLKGIEVDMRDMPDATQTLAILACFAEGKTVITGIAHLAHKESDRIGETAIELRKLGISVEASSDSMTIHGGRPHGALIDPRKDHRMAMSLALAGLKIPGLKISDEKAVDKSFPTYWKKLEELGAGIIYGRL